MPASLDYYQVLQIDKDASDQQIKKAYRKLALKFHPDKNSSADAVEKILSDPEKRRVYDNHGSNPMHDDDYDYHNPFAGFAFHSPEEIFAEFFNHMSAFGRGGDLFSSFMMPPMHQAPPPPPPFGGFSHPFMMGGFGDTSGFFGHDFMSLPMMGSSSFQQQQSFIGSSQNSSRGLGNGSSGGYSKSVSTTTRNVNGVMESVKITKITDGNASVSACPCASSV
ncbi:DnaJ domain-containing protein [Mucor lusitanicus]